MPLIEPGTSPGASRRPRSSERGFITKDTKLHEGKKKGEKDAPADLGRVVTRPDGWAGGMCAGNAVTTMGISDTGGIALIQTDGVTVIVIDQVGMSGSPSFEEGSFLSPLIGYSDQSYERRPGGISGNCTDTDNNVADFKPITPADPQNSSKYTTACIGKDDQTISFTSTAPDNAVVGGAHYNPIATVISGYTFFILR